MIAHLLRVRDDMTDFDSRMKNNGIRPTAVRQMIYRVLQEAPGPLSGLEIEQILDTVDRSTITRTIALFHEAELLHAIDDGSGAMKYELCSSKDHHTAADLHPHFHCRACGRTLCLTGVALPELPLPEGFRAESSNLTITGLCPDCR